MANVTHREIGQCSSVMVISKAEILGGQVYVQWLITLLFSSLVDEISIHLVLMKKRVDHPSFVGPFY